MRYVTLLLLVMTFTALGEGKTSNDWLGIPSEVGDQGYVWFYMPSKVRLTKLNEVIVTVRIKRKGKKSLVVLLETGTKKGHAFIRNARSSYISGSKKMRRAEVSCVGVYNSPVAKKKYLVFRVKDY